MRRRRDPAGGAAGAASNPAPGSREPIVTGQGITIYPARCEGDRWRAVWYEPDGSRGQCQSVSEHGLAAKLEKVTERLAADGRNMLRSGSELIAYYLSDDRRPAERAWSRRHADTQRDLCTRYLEPVIGHLACQDIRVADMQAVVNAAPTAKEGSVECSLSCWSRRSTESLKRAGYITDAHAFAFHFGSCMGRHR